MAGGTVFESQKSAPCRILRLCTRADISKYTLYDGLVRLLMAHGALSGSGATRFALYVKKGLGLYFLPSSAEVAGSPSSWRGFSLDSFIRPQGNQGKGLSPKKRPVGRNLRALLKIKSIIVMETIYVTVQGQGKRRSFN